MNIKHTVTSLILALSCLSITASAQKNYTEGSAIYTVNTQAGDAEAKVAFNSDSSEVSVQQGPALIKMLANNKGTYMAILVDVPLASIKKAAVLTPDELGQTENAAPKFTFIPTTETKVINGFNCKKVVAKDAKSGTSTDVWVTTDITAPQNLLSRYFVAAGGFPVQFVGKQMGQSATMTLKSIDSNKPVAGTFGIPAGFDRISVADLNSLGGAR
ncbi:MAG: hypothetical protein ABI367_15490 [Mucilaginibacter sp.]